MRCRLARGHYTVVATLAGTHGFVMIDGNSRRPGVAVVAGFADVTGENMTDALSRGRNTVVTGNAGLRSSTVIKAANKPVTAAVTGFARFDGRNMRRSFAGGDYAVVATVAGAEHLGMIDQGIDWRPGNVVMTCFAHFTAGNVRGRFATGCHAIVAANTARSGGTVIKA